MALAVGSSDISNELWQSALEALERKFSKPIFEMWIKPIRLVSISGEALVLSVQSNFARDWVEHRLKTQIAEVLTEVLGASLDLQFAVAEPETTPAGAAPAAPPVVRQPEEMRSSSLNARYTFDEFVIGNSNRFAHAASQAVAEAPATAYNPLFLYGGVGLGKTHLMHAIGHRVLIAQSQAPTSSTCRARSSPTNSSSRSRTTRHVEFRNRYRHVDVLLIDDIQFLEGKETNPRGVLPHVQLAARSAEASSSSRATVRRKRFKRSSRACARDSNGACSPTSSRRTSKRAKRFCARKPRPKTSPCPTKCCRSSPRSSRRTSANSKARSSASSPSPSLTKSPITVDLAAEVLKNAVAAAPMHRVTIG